MSNQTIRALMVSTVTALERGDSLTSTRLTMTSHHSQERVGLKINYWMWERLSIRSPIGVESYIYERNFRSTNRLLEADVIHCSIDK